MDFGKEASLGVILSWPSASMWGRVSQRLGASGLPCEYGDAPKSLAGLLYLFEGQCRTHWGKEEKHWLPHWTGLTVGQLEAEAQVRKLEEKPRLEKDTELSTVLLDLGMADRWESRITRRRR